MMKEQPFISGNLATALLFLDITLKVYEFELNLDDRDCIKPMLNTNEGDYTPEEFLAKIEERRAPYQKREIELKPRPFRDKDRKDHQDSDRESYQDRDRDLFPLRRNRPENEPSPNEPRQSDSDFN